MKADTLGKIGDRYELTVILILILAAPLCAYTLLNINSSTHQGIGVLALISLTNLISDVSALFSIRGIDQIKKLDQPVYRRKRNTVRPIHPLNWIVMLVMSAVTLVSTAVILKNTEFVKEFLVLSGIQLFLCVYASVLGVRTMKLSGPGRETVRPSR